MSDTKKTFLHFMIPPEILARVDEFRFANRFESRSAAILALIEKGLSIKLKRCS